MKLRNKNFLSLSILSHNYAQTNLSQQYLNLIWWYCAE